MRRVAALPTSVMFRGVRLRVALVPVIALAVSLAACSPDDEPAAEPSQGPVTGAGPSVYGPLQDARQAGADYLTAQTAINKQLDAVWSACMKARGYDLAPPTPSREQILTDGFHIAYGTDIANPTVRAAEGYGVTSRLVGIPSVYDRVNGVTEYVKTLTDAQRTAFGVVLDGCSDEAHTKVLPTAELTQFDDASQDIALKIRSDGRVQAARAQWAGCMQAAGLPYRQPDGVADALDARARPLYKAAKPGVVTPAARALHAEELRVAAADWNCRKSTITPAFMSVRNELEGQFLDQNPELADRVWDRMAAVIGKG